MKRIASALLLVALVSPPRPRMAQTTVTGFRADFFAQQDGVEKQLLALAEATPADKFGWRPAEGVRSISEVYMHLVGRQLHASGLRGHQGPGRRLARRWRSP